MCSIFATLSTSSHCAHFLCNIMAPDLRISTTNCFLDEPTPNIHIYSHILAFYFSDCLIWLTFALHLDGNLTNDSPNEIH